MCEFEFMCNVLSKKISTSALTRTKKTNWQVQGNKHHTQKYYHKTKTTTKILQQTTTFWDFWLQLVDFSYNLTTTLVQIFEQKLQLQQKKTTTFGWKVRLLTTTFSIKVQLLANECDKKYKIRLKCQRLILLMCFFLCSVQWDLSNTQ